MPQANEKSIWTETFIADADLSEKQYFAVRQGAAEGGIALVNGATDIPVGILLNQPKAGQEALVCVIGRCPVKLGGTVSAGGLIMSHTDGTLKAFVPKVTDNTKYGIGQCTRGGAINEVGEALIQAAIPVKGDQTAA